MMRGGKNTAEPETDRAGELSRMQAEINRLRGEQHPADTTSR